MLAVRTATRFNARGATRAVVVAGQRQGAVQAVRRRDNTSVRGIQSVAQTDRVRWFLHKSTEIQLNISFLGYHYPFTILYWYQAGG